MGYGVVNLLAAWPIRLEYFSALTALGLFAALALPILWLGFRSLSGLGPVRKWVAIGARLGVVALLILILGGIRWQRQHKDLEVIVLRDISQSTGNVRTFPGKSLQASVDDFLQKLAGKEHKPPRDTIGVIGFSDNASIEALPNTTLALEARAIRQEGNGTDVANALQLALATMSRDAMHRLLLIWDGNQTTGDLDAAIAAAAAQSVPVDVLPLRYNVQNEVLMDRLVAPNWKRQGEPFTIDIILRSTNPGPTTGKLTVLHQDQPMDMDPATPGVQASKLVTLQPGPNVQRVRVPALQEAGVHRFRAVFEGPNVTATIDGQERPGAGGDTLLQNNVAEAFTFVRGRGQVLFIDNTSDGGGTYLASALARERIDLKRIGVEDAPRDIVSLQNYDAVILANVPRGAGGLSEDQQKMLASYVHDLGGGLVMIGGPDTFGAGGWQGSRLEEILPVTMDVPAQRQIPKGALVLIMHSCEMPDGNYWGEQCAIKAVETLSQRDEIGVISFDWSGGGGARWDFSLQPKGTGSTAVAAIKNMKLGDMPSFDDAMSLALNGAIGQRGLKDTDARQKHVIIISDGDPAPPARALVEQYRAAKVTVSTVSVYPHQGTVPPTMQQIANVLGGRAYGPISANFSQLPQIFIKEATIVRRSLITENSEGIALLTPPTASELVKGLEAFPPVYGMVLTSRKPSPQIEFPIVAGKQQDPLFAHWQTGLGRAAVFTSDAHNKWAANWVGSAMYDKFWSQVVRGVSRPPMSSDFDVQTVLEGERGKVTVEALSRDNTALNFLSIRGQIVGPDMKPRDIRLLQTGPGVYTADFDTPVPGSYVLVLNYQDSKGNGGVLLSGVAMNSSPELRDLRSNDALLEQIAQRTGGRVLSPFDLPDADVFRREGLTQTASPLPVWDLLIPVLLGLFLADVAIRRIAWNWQSTRRMLSIASQTVRQYTTLRKVETTHTLDALRKVREEAAEKPSADQPAPPRRIEPPAGIEGDTTQVLGGATAAPPITKTTAAPSSSSPAGHTGSLLEAKRRARQQMEAKQKEQP